MSKPSDKDLSKREFLASTATTMALASLPASARKALAAKKWDVIIIGGGSAGLPAAIFAAERGGSVLVIEGSHRIGGTLDRSSGQMSAAGTSLQKAKGIADTADLHYQDVMRISQNTANPEMVRLAVDNAADTIEWLIDLGWEALPEHPVRGLGHEPYKIERYQWGAEGGVSVYRALEPKVLQLAAQNKLTILTNTEAVQLLTDGASVTGVVARGPDGQTLNYNAANVVITTGGAGGDPEMFEYLNGAPLYVRMAYPYNKGVGVKLAESVGGYIRGKEHFLCNDGDVLTDTAYPTPQLANAETNSERRKPWEVYVNVDGQRFVKEDSESVDVREHAVLQQPNHRYWAIFDSEILSNAPPFLLGWTAEEIRLAFGKYHMFSKGETISELAHWAGINGSNLENTIARYNSAQANDKDPAFNREHMPLPVTTPPFYAIRMQAYSILVFGGVAVDTSLRVLRKDSSPVPNLYAAGEVLGKGTLTGQSYVGGMSLTPALTFGRLLGEKLLDLGT